MKEAISEGLDRSEIVVNQLDVWRNKWVYEEARRFYTSDINIDDSEAKKYLRITYPVMELKTEILRSLVKL